ncbi:MAG: helix-turn-helix transcriptional regulator [Deltaproteobacteria bacterium]|nr:helix-turn-helix transcriptional regulator [Deltaproteobacteria bacterium]
MSGRRRPPTPRLDDALVDEVKAQRLDSLSGPDSPEGRALGAAVGKSVARHRAARGWTLERLAERSGTRPALLRALEQGQGVPSLRAIWHLATALEVPFGALLAGTVLSRAADPDFRIQRSGQGHVISSADGLFRSRPLFAEGDPRAPEVYELTLAAGCREDAAPHAPRTFEHLAMVRGRLVVRCAEAAAEIGPGDALFFRADLPHSYENPGGEDAVAHLVMTYGAASSAGR